MSGLRSGNHESITAPRADIAVSDPIGINADEGHPAQHVPPAHKVIDIRRRGPRNMMTDEFRDAVEYTHRMEVVVSTNEELMLRKSLLQ